MNISRNMPPFHNFFGILRNCAHVSARMWYDNDVFYFLQKGERE